MRFGWGLWLLWAKGLNITWNLTWLEAILFSVLGLSLINKSINSFLQKKQYFLFIKQMFCQNEIIKKCDFKVELSIFKPCDCYRIDDPRQPSSLFHLYFFNKYNIKTRAPRMSLFALLRSYDRPTDKPNPPTIQPTDQLTNQ